MGDGPVAVEQARVSHAGTIYRNIDITDSRAHLGDSYVTHNYYRDDDPGFEILRELSDLSYRGVHQQIQHLRLPDTGSWLLESDEYLQWRDGAASNHLRHFSLWCHGAPGVGKTFLASSMVDNLRESIQGQQRALIYLYANRDRSFEQNVSSYLCCIARQLVENIHGSERSTSLDSVRRHVRVKDGLTSQALQNLCGALILHFDRVYVLLDALDEFSEDPDGRLRLIDALLSIQRAFDPGKVRICLTSRPSSTCEERLGSHWSKAITLSEDDLSSFIRNRIANSARLSSLCRYSMLEREIESEVIKASNGVFKVASLQMNDIARQVSRAGIKATLKKLSSHTAFYYTRSLERISRNEDFGLLIKRMLGWLLALREPLEDGEFAHVLGVDGDTPLDVLTTDVEVHLPTLIDMAEGFVQDYPSGYSRITFVHDTAREFLRSNLTTARDLDWNADIACTYMRYVCLDTCVCDLERDCNEQFAPYKIRVTQTAGYSLLLKAARSWELYAALVGQDMSNQLVCDFTLSMLGRVTSLPMLCSLYGWPSVVRVLASLGHLKPLEPMNQLYSPLHVAVSLGQTDVVRALLESNCAAGTRRFGHFTNQPPATHAPDSAKVWGFIDIKLTWMYTSFEPLVCALPIVRWGIYCMLHRRLNVSADVLEMVEESEEEMSDVNFPDVLDRVREEPPFGDAYISETYGNTPLHLAVDVPLDNPGNDPFVDRSCNRHNSSMLKLFLARSDVDVNAVGFAGFTPLFVAICSADVEAAQALLGHRGVDVNLTTRTDNALTYTIHRMCFQRYESPENEEILDIFAETADSSTFERLMQILRRVLEHTDIHVNEPDFAGYTALEWLCFYRNLVDDEEVQRFVSSGQDWVGCTGRDLAGQVLEFYQKCDLPFDDVAALLRRYGARTSRSVDFEDWLLWFCPPPQRMPLETTKKDHDTDELDEVYLLRTPFADGYASARV